MLSCEIFLLFQGNNLPIFFLKNLNFPFYLNIIISAMPKELPFNLLISNSNLDIFLLNQD